MFYDSLEFRAMQSGLDALWLKQKVISQNIANYETPGYKAKSVAFANVLEDARGAQTDGRYDFKAEITTQNRTEVRPDGNNVDSEVESLALFDTYLQSAYLYQKIGGKFTDMRYVLSQAFK